MLFSIHPVICVLLAFLASHIAFMINVLHVRKGVYVAHDIQKECPESGIIMERDTTRYQLYKLFKELDNKHGRHVAFHALWIIAVVTISISLIWCIAKRPWSNSFVILCLSLIVMLGVTNAVMYNVVGMADGKRTKLAHMTNMIRDIYVTDILANMPTDGDALLDALPHSFEKDIMHRWLLVNPLTKDTKPVTWKKLENDEKMGYFVPKDDYKLEKKVSTIPIKNKGGVVIDNGKSNATKLNQLFKSLTRIQNPNHHNEIKSIKNVFRGLEFLTVFPIIVATIGWRLYAVGWINV